MIPKINLKEQCYIMVQMSPYNMCLLNAGASLATSISSYLISDTAGTFLKICQEVIWWHREREERGSYLWAVLGEQRWGKEPGNQTRGAFSSLWETFHCTPLHKTFQRALQIWNINRNSSSSVDWRLFPHLLCTKQRINTTGNICVRPYWLI